MGFGDGSHPVIEVGVDDDGCGLGIQDDVLELWLRMLNTQWDRGTAGPPHTPLDRDVVDARRDEEGNPVLGEVGTAIEKTRGPGSGPGEEIAVGELALWSDKGGSDPMIGCAGYEWGFGHGGYDRGVVRCCQLR